MLCIALDGPPAIAALLQKTAHTLSAYPVFFSALAIAKAVGCTIALRR